MSAYQAADFSEQHTLISRSYARVIILFCQARDAGRFMREAYEMYGIGGVLYSLIEHQTQPLPNVSPGRSTGFEISHRTAGLYVVWLRCNGEGRDMVLQRRAAQRDAAGARNEGLRRTRAECW
jgi:hypothetical protein